jgi:hypothetical protein
MQERFNAPLTYHFYPGKDGETPSRMPDIGGTGRMHQPSAVRHKAPPNAPNPFLFRTLEVRRCDRFRCAARTRCHSPTIVRNYTRKICTTPGVWKGIALHRLIAFNICKSLGEEESYVRNAVITQPAWLSCQFGGSRCFRNKPTGSHSSWAGPRRIYSFQPQQWSQDHEHDHNERRR